MIFRILIVLHHHHIQIITTIHKITIQLVNNLLLNHHRLLNQVNHHLKVIMTRILIVLLHHHIQAISNHPLTLVHNPAQAKIVRRQLLLHHKIIIINLI